ncbi:hypothetical protein FA13DRAFT_1716834, partial [Coprinellus micaceus]
MSWLVSCLRFCPVKSAAVTVRLPFVLGGTKEAYDTVQVEQDPMKRTTFSGFCSGQNSGLVELNGFPLLLVQLLPVLSCMFASVMKATGYDLGLIKTPISYLPGRLSSNRVVLGIVTGVTRNRAPTFRLEAEESASLALGALKEASAPAFFSALMIPGSRELLTRAGTRHELTNACGARSWKM